MWEQEANARIVIEENCFRLKAADEICVKWKSVRRIRAYKIDLITFDEIRLSFDLDNAEPVEISEEQPDFDRLLAAVRERFDFAHDWWLSVVQPPFATNETILFVRSD